MTLTTAPENDDWFARALAHGDREGQQEARLEELRQQAIDTEMRTFTRSFFGPRPTNR